MQICAGDEQPRRAPLSRRAPSRTAWRSCRTRARGSRSPLPVAIATPSAVQPTGRQRRPSSRSVLRAGLALEPLRGGHRDEDERERAADPDGRGEQMDDAECELHGRESLGERQRRARPADRRRRDAHARSRRQRDRAAERRRVASVRPRAADRAPARPGRALQHVGAPRRCRAAPGPTARRCEPRRDPPRAAARRRDRQASARPRAVKSPLCQPPTLGSSRTRNWISIVTPGCSQTRTRPSRCISPGAP